ncbi:hypothetical protein [Enterobacter chengduensis]|uniref:hypothetical protein n=2 Tax=Enterobacter chengduensis TaxID=2494701 RepID=UPI003D6FC8C1
MSVKRYEVNGPSSVFEDENGSLVDHEDYAALEARCAVLAAEISAVLTDRAVILEDLDNTCFEIGMQRGEKVDAYPTPTVANHDAFLAEVRAQGVEMMAVVAEQLMDEFGDDSYKVMVTADLQRFANAFAAQIRKGAAQ